MNTGTNNQNEQKCCFILQPLLLFQYCIEWGYILKASQLDLRDEGTKEKVKSKVTPMFSPIFTIYEGEDWR